MQMVIMHNLKQVTECNIEYDFLGVYKKYKIDIVILQIKKGIIVADISQLSSKKKCRKCKSNLIEKKKCHKHMSTDIEKEKYCVKISKLNKIIKTRKVQFGIVLSIHGIEKEECAGAVKKSYNIDQGLVSLVLIQPGKQTIALFL